MHERQNRLFIIISSPRRVSASGPCGRAALHKPQGPHSAKPERETPRVRKTYISKVSLLLNDFDSTYNSPGPFNGNLI